MNVPINSMSIDTALDSDPLRDPALYFNRELSQLDFNFRVLAQAQDPAMPLLERLRYLCISCTNLDEFFEIRAATVRHAQDFGVPPAADGLSPATVLKRIHDRAKDLVDAQYRCWNEVLRPALNDAGVRVLARDSWNAKQTRWLRAYFRDEILPVLSPLGLDPAHPFPKILNKSLNIVVVLKGKDAFGRAGHLAIVRAPRSLPRIIQLPHKVSGGEHDFVFLSAVLSAFVDELFPGMEVKGAYQFRVTRNSELIVDDEEVENLALALRDELVGRYACTILLATHNTDEAFGFCDRVAVLHKGRVLATGATQALSARFGEARFRLVARDASHPAFALLERRGLLQRTEVALPLPSRLTLSDGTPSALSTDSTLAAVSPVTLSTVLPVVTCSAGESPK